jgi:hypothetical protein
MFNTWFTDIVRNANERTFNDAELTRIMAYYSSMPARLRLNEELERIETSLLKPLQAELSKRFPGRPLYTKRFVQDILESLRHLNKAVLADDLKLVRRPWVDHIVDTMAATDIDPMHVIDAYHVIREMLVKKLSKSAWEVLEPVYDDMLDALTRGPAMAV